MLVVLADDFSGAAEIAGIAFRYGLSSEVQLDFDRTTKADLVVLDTDTRGSSEEEAVKKLSAIATTLKDSGLRICFKKIDSVLRGHLVPEIDALQRVFQFNRAIIMSANPVRGRKIISGSYYVNGQSLEQTVFAKDPSFPTATASVEKIISKKQSLFNQVHVSPGDKLPTSSLITGDVSSKEDLKKYAEVAGETDLCCGAAEFFEAFLEHKGFAPNDNFANIEWPPYSIIISGSTVRDQFEKEELQKHIVHIALVGAWKGDEFILEKEEELAWQNEVLRLLKKDRLVYISILHEIKHVKGAAEIFSGYFVQLVKRLSEELEKANIHFALTGGATASAIIRNTVRHGLFVKKEIASGIVTLIDQAANTLYSVKPGSYLWPTSFLESLIDQTK
jgi:D-threonate/D-erythronate kinase